MTPLGNKLGEDYSAGKRYFAEILTITPLGIPLISSIGDFDDELRWGIERTSLGVIFQLHLAEDNPVRLLWGVTSEYGWGEHLYSAGDKLPKSTGEDDSTLAGKLFKLRWGMAPLGVSCIPPGNILIFC